MIPCCCEYFCFGFLETITLYLKSLELITLPGMELTLKSLRPGKVWLLVQMQQTEFLKRRRPKALILLIARAPIRSWSKEVCTRISDAIRRDSFHSITFFLCQIIVFRFQILKFIKLHLHSVTYLEYRLLLGKFGLFRDTLIDLRECRFQGGDDVAFVVVLHWKQYHRWTLLVYFRWGLGSLLISKLSTNPV